MGVDITAFLSEALMLYIVLKESWGLLSVMDTMTPGCCDGEHDALSCVCLVLGNFEDELGEVCHQVAPELDKLAGMCMMSVTRGA